MKRSTEWGIAMEGCEEVITKAIKDAIGKFDVDTELVYLEIGAGAGQTLNQVCKILKDEGRSFFATAIDLEDGWSLNVEEFYKNTEEHGENITLNLEGSPKALKEYPEDSIFAVLIDGDHTKEAVIEDFKEADRIVMDGGLILFHDSGIDDQGADPFERQPKGIQVREAIEELGLLEGNDNYKVLADHQKTLNGRGIFIIQKR